MKKNQFIALLALVFFVFTSKGQQISFENNKVLIEKAYADTIKELNLSALGLKTIPQNIGDFPLLRKLDLSNNKIEELGNLEAIKNLEVLILDGNLGLKASALNNSLPALHNLKELSISHSGLLFVPYELYQLVSLEKVSLANNEIGVISTEISGLINLKSLDLANNQIEFIDNGFQYLQALEILNLSSNPILNKEHLFLQLAQLSRLSKVSIDDADVENNLIISAVEQMDLTNCNKLRGNSLVKNFPALQAINIEGIMAEEGLGVLLGKLSADTLKKMSIINAEITTLPNNIMQFRKLTQLHLNTASLEKLPVSVNRLKKLQQLSIHSENLDLNALTTRLIPLKNLEQLKIESTELDALSKQLTQVKGLKRVELVTRSEQIENLDYLKEEMPNCEFVVSSQLDNKEKNGLNPPLENVDVAFDEFIVDASKGDQITTPSGTEILIPKNAFLDQEDKVVKGNVLVEYREFSDPIDMAFAGVPMTEKENGETFTYSSAGMMQFRVKKNNEELKPNPDSLITVNYNSPFEGNEYDLFYLDPEKEAWLNIGKDSLIKPTEQEEQKWLVENEETPVRPIYPSFPYRKNKLSLCVNDKEKRRTTYINLHSNSPKRWSRRDTNNKVFSELRYFSKIKWEVDYGTRDFKEGNDSLKALVARINRYNIQSSNVPRRIERSQFTWRELSLFNDYWIEPNVKSDNFNLVLSVAGKLYRIPVVPAKLPKRAESAQRKMKQIYTSFNKNLEKRRSDWEKVDNNKAEEVIAYQKNLAAFEEMMDDYRSKMSQYNRIELEKIKTYAASEENIIRSFSLLSFGLFNCDIRRSLDNPEPLLAQLKNEEGNRLSIRSLYILDRESNGLLTFNKQKGAFFEFDHTNSIIAVLTNNKVAVLRSEDFAMNAMNRRATEVRLKTYNMKKTSIAELKKYGDFF